MEDGEITSKKIRTVKYQNESIFDNQNSDSVSGEYHEKTVKKNLEKEKPNFNYSYKSAICRFFLNNSCTRGDNCAFSHNIRNFPCRAFHLRKNCTRKLCTYSHDPVSMAVFNKMKEDDMKEKKSFISPFH